MAGILLVAACLLSFFPAYGGTITENFDNNQYNSQWWEINSVTPGVVTTVANNRLEISVPATASPGTDYLGFIGLSFETALMGDFDMQADFTLLNWPEHNQAQIVMGMGAGSFHLARRSRGVNEGDGSEVYFAITMGQWVGDRPAGGPAGKLRMKRTGNTMEGFFWDGTAWQLVGSYTDVNLGIPTNAFIGLDRNNQSYGPAVQIAIDNIQLTYAATGQFISETFDDNIYDEELFGLNSSGVAAVTVANDELQVAISANDGTFFSAAGLGNMFNLVGDFDIQVDFSLPVWPAANGVNAGIVMPIGGVTRNSYHDGLGDVDAYLAYFAWGQRSFSVNTSDTAGKLRLTRTGNTMEAFYWHDGGWVFIGSHTDPQLGAPVSGYIGAYSGGNYQTKAVQTAFDNYQIIYNQISFGNRSRGCPAIPLLLLD